MIKASVLGATGYAGSVLVGLLSSHGGVEIAHLTSHSYAGKKFSDVYPGMKGMCDILLEDDDISKASEGSDVVFMALPAGLSSKYTTPELIEKCVVIDIGSDFRIHNLDTYLEWYKVEHFHPELLSKAVYGLPEIHRKKIKSGKIIANPGCYTTCSILTLYPMVKNHLIDTDTIIIDAKSGTSGAGRAEKISSLYCEVNESIKPYGIANHRHTPEIEQELSEAAGAEIHVQFTPHLVPMNRGILSCCYAKLKKGVTDSDVGDAYSMYEKERCVRLIDSPPETKFVRGTNLVDISWKIDKRTGNIIMMGALDNLVKGASGQAVQNMNIVFGIEETEGLPLAAYV